MKISEKQRKDIECIKYFIPKTFSKIPITIHDEIKFLEYSDQGMHKNTIDGSHMTIDGFHALIEGKRWRGIHVHEMYEPGVLDGSTPYHTILGGNKDFFKRKWWEFWKPKFTFIHEPIQRVVVDFLKKEMFKGIDAEIIESAYRNLFK